ncbi:DUF805 domain-containing protein [Rosenbergiella epipactidis]|uniref:DUF805 domain-containing protein n=1 Tax=Rosenbergiella epipactidis TaxID=1544694 RepID=UPI003D6AFD70
MLETLMQRLLAVLRCYKRTFSYQEVEDRGVYTLFLLPLISLASRRINDAGYSHWIILLVFFIPYLFFIFSVFQKQ